MIISNGKSFGFSHFHITSVVFNHRSVIFFLSSPKPIFLLDEAGSAAILLVILLYEADSAAILHLLIDLIDLIDLIELIGLIDYI